MSELRSPKSNFRRCKLCKKKLVGRKDKIFCTIACKNDYHFRLRTVNRNTTYHLDKILHRNRAILLEIMGKKAEKVKILKVKLDQKKFNYSYITGMHINKQGKTVYHIYDFSYIPFSSQEILITRNLRFLKLFENNQDVELT